MARYSGRLRFILGIVAISVVWAMPARAANILINGSFESGLTGWIQGGTYSGYPVSVIVTDGSTGSAFGEAVPADTIVGGSPDLAGTHGAYFVDDLANQFLTQSVWLEPGTYEVGFDTYSPRNGYDNHYDAYFSGAVVNVILADYSVHDSAPAVWLHYSGLASVSAAGSYDASFAFQTLGVPAADVVVDRVYITASTEDGGTPIPPAVPEPASLLLLATGLVGAARAWKKRSV
jgi:PEP-CTERM motif